MAIHTCSYFVIALCIFIQAGLNMAVLIEVNQERFKNVINDEIRISCTPGEERDIAKDIILIEIVKEGDKPTVVIRPGRKVSYPNGHHPRIEAVGYISKTVRHSFLNMTLREPESGDSGTYTCVMYFLTHDGFVKETRASSNVTDDNFDLITLEQMILKRLSILEHAVKELAGKDSSITKNMTDFATEISQQMHGLNQKDSDIMNTVTVFKNQTSKQLQDLDNKDTAIVKNMTDFDAEISQHLKDLDQKDSDIMSTMAAFKNLTYKQLGDLSDKDTDLENKIKNLNDIMKICQRDMWQQINDLRDKDFSIISNMTSFRKETSQNLQDLDKEDSAIMDALQDFINKTSHQIDDLEEKDSNTTKRLDALENKTATQILDLKDKHAVIVETMASFKNETQQQLYDLEDKANYTVSFSVTNKGKKVVTKNNEILILPDLVMQVGQGYNVTSGIFTAPRDGVYAFHLMALEMSSCALDIDMYANKQVLVKLMVFDDRYYTQTSVSAVTNLKAGDTVYNIARDDNCALYFRQYSVFTGYLVQAL